MNLMFYIDINNLNFKANFHRTFTTSVKTKTF